MSTNQNSSRDAFNAGSDTKGRYEQGSVLEQFKRATATPAPTEQGTPRVRDLPVGPSSEGAIKNK